MTNEQLDALVKKLQSQIGDDVQQIYSHEALFKGAADALTTLRARAESAENAAKTARFWEATAKRRIEMMQKYYLRDAKLALGGDLRALRNRVAMMEAEPMQIVPSDAALAAHEERKQG